MTQAKKSISQLPDRILLVASLMKRSAPALLEVSNDIEVYDASQQGRITVRSNRVQFRLDAIGTLARR